MRFMIFEILMPTWLLFDVRIRPGRLQEAFETPQDAPTWCPRRSKSRSKGAQDASRTAQELPKTHQAASRKRPTGAFEPGETQALPQNRPKAPRTPPDLDFGPFWQRFCQDFETVLRDFSKFLEGRNSHTFPLGGLSPEHFN